MRVMRSSWRGTQVTMSLVEALTPEDPPADMRHFIGSVLAALVTSGALTLADAGALVYEYDLETVE